MTVDELDKIADRIITEKNKVINDLEREIEQAWELLDIFVDHFGKECRFDHEGYCQNHLLENYDECSVAKAVEWLDKNKGK